VLGSPVSIRLMSGESVPPVALVGVPGAQKTTESDVLIVRVERQVA